MSRTMMFIQFKGTVWFFNVKQFNILDVLNFDKKLKNLCNIILWRTMINKKI